MDTGAGTVQLMLPREEVLSEQRIGPVGAALWLVRPVAILEELPTAAWFRGWDELP